MVTAGDGRAPAPYERHGDDEKGRKRLLGPEINEEQEPHNVSQEGGLNISTGVSAQDGNSAITLITEFEQLWKQKALTSSEIRHPTTMEYLPGDLLLNIFIRLLAKQLAQMRCVSKSWNGLISQPSFVKSHLHHSINNDNRVLLVFSNKSSERNQELLRAYSSRSPHLELTNIIKLPPVIPKSGHTTSTIKVIGSIHGLICSCYGDDVIHIWNPSLSAVSTLPPYFMPSCSGIDNYFRFGFDPKTEDYKVVKLSGLIKPPTRYNGTLSYVVRLMLQVEVYSMRKGSWKLITQRFPSHITRIYEPDYLCVDGHEGHLHWLGYSDEGEVHTIVAFDLGLETFREMPLPDAILNYHSKLLGVLAGKICVISWAKDILVVWVMDEYGVGESWVKHHILKPFINDFVFGYTSRNEILIVNESRDVLLYNPATHEANILKKSFHGKYHVNKIVECVDSLVWVTPAVR